MSDPISSTSTLTTSATPVQPNHFVLSARDLNTPGKSGVLIKVIPDCPHIALISKGFQKFGEGKIPTFLDSGASNTMFVLRDPFITYTPITSQVGDSAKAKDGNFDIIGEGNVSQQYIVDGKEHKITFTHALHTPSLNANLILISALDCVGLTTVFGNGKGITKKTDGTVILRENIVNGMYLLEPIDELMKISQISVSLKLLSQTINLEQWHRCLAHCSPLMIQDMANSNLVDGLRISTNDLTGKCEDCIMGCQTRCPFDGETEKKLDPLELVSFDLWGLSHVQSAGGKVYMMFVIDAGTSYKYGTYLKDKSDSTMLAAFDIFHSQAEMMMGRKIH